MSLQTIYGHFQDDGSDKPTNYGDIVEFNLNNITNEDMMRRASGAGMMRKNPGLARSETISALKRRQTMAKRKATLRRAQSQKGNKPQSTIQEENESSVPSTPAPRYHLIIFFYYS